MIDRNIIAKRLKEDMPEASDRYLDLKVDKLLNNYLEELEANLIEWIDHKPLSDIYIGELSINILTREWGFLDIVGAFAGMKAYKDCGCGDGYWIIHRRLTM